MQRSVVCNEDFNWRGVGRRPTVLFNRPLALHSVRGDACWRREELTKSYSYSPFISLSYRFRSKLNNCVNPRFQTGGGSTRNLLRKKALSAISQTRCW